MLTHLRSRWPLLLPASASIAVVLAIYPSLSGEPDLSGDIPFHIGSAHEVADALAEGANPLGPMPQAFGVPVARFYQPLTYLVVGATSALTGASTRDLLAWLVLLCLVASPWSYYAMMRALGAEAPAAALVGLLALASNSAFSHSLGAYFETGIQTQAMGAAVFPLFVGGFARLLRGEGGALSTAFRFAVASLSHATLIVYATFVGLLALVTMPIRIREATRGLVRFVPVAFALVAFWVIPFLVFNEVHRPISDAVTRPKHVGWFVGASPSELARLAVSGRLLDGPRGDAQPDEAVIRRLNGSFGMPTRPPFLSILALLGILVSLRRLGRDPERFLLSGLALSLLLLLGPDDAPLPFAKSLLYKAQPFRATYLVDFFCIALAGLGIHRIAVGTLRLLEKRPPAATRAARIAFGAVTTAGALAFGAYLVFTGWEITGPTPWSQIPASLQALAQVPPPGRPPGRWTIQLGRGRREHRLRDWMLSVGYPTHHHMTGLGPITAYYQGRRILRRVEDQDDLARLLGVRYVLADGQAAALLRQANLAARGDRFRRIVRGPMQIWESVDPEVLHVPSGPRVLVVATNEQWIWLLAGWMGRHASDALDPSTPFPVRVDARHLRETATREAVDAVLVADVGAVASEKQTLKRFVERGGVVLAAERIAGVRTRVLAREDATWEVAVPPLAALRPTAPSARPVRRRLGGPYEFRTSYAERTLVLLPEHHYDGWRAEAGGREIATFAAGPDVVAAFVPEGTRKLRFEYRMIPAESWTLVLSAIAWIGIASWGGLGLLAWLRSRRRARPSAGAVV